MILTFAGERHGEGATGRTEGGAGQDGKAELSQTAGRGYQRLAFGTAFSPTGGQPTAVQEVTRTTVRRHRMRMPRVRSTFAQGALTKFVDPLPVPPVLLPSSINIVDGTLIYEVRMQLVR